MENSHDDWILYTNVTCKKCGRSAKDSVAIRGSNLFRACKCGWIIEIPKKKIHKHINV